MAHNHVLQVYVIISWFFCQFVTGIFYFTNLYYGGEMVIITAYDIGNIEGIQTHVAILYCNHCWCFWTFYAFYNLNFTFENVLRVSPGGGKCTLIVRKSSPGGNWVSLLMVLVTQDKSCILTCKWETSLPLLLEHHWLRKTPHRVRPYWSVVKKHLFLKCSHMSSQWFFHCLTFMLWIGVIRIYLPYLKCWHLLDSRGRSSVHMQYIPRLTFDLMNLIDDNIWDMANIFLWILILHGAILRPFPFKSELFENLTPVKKCIDLSQIVCILKTEHRMN